MTFRSSDNPGGIADPFVGSMRELECVEGLEWEAEAMDPIPTGRINIEVSIERGNGA